MDFFLWILWNFLKHQFYRTPPVATAFETFRPTLKENSAEIQKLDFTEMSSEIQYISQR